MIRVMVAEDFDVIRQDLVDVINKEDDMTVINSFSSGRDAVSSCKAGDADVFLMDIEMENPDAGIQAAEQLLEAAPELKIIYLTSHDEDQVIITAMATGAADYFVKTEDSSDVLEHIRGVYRGENVLSEKVQRVLMGEYRRLRKSEQSLLYFISYLGSLTSAERELISCLLKGMKVREIADYRGVEPVTVKAQIITLLHKFGVSRTSEIVKTIKELGLEHLFLKG